MDNTNRRAPLRKGRRIPICLSLSPETHRELGKICAGNRSAAVESLVRDHVERLRAPIPELVT